MNQYLFDADLFVTGGSWYARKSTTPADLEKEQAEREAYYRNDPEFQPYRDDQ